jgi:hypothetical protein
MLVLNDSDDPDFLTRLERGSLSLCSRPTMNSEEQYVEPR